MQMKVVVPVATFLVAAILLAPIFCVIAIDGPGASKCDSLIGGILRFDLPQQVDGLLFVAVPLLLAGIAAVAIRWRSRHRE